MTQRHCGACKQNYDVFDSVCPRCHQAVKEYVQVAKACAGKIERLQIANMGPRDILVIYTNSPTATEAIAGMTDFSGCALVMPQNSRIETMPIDVLRRIVDDAERQLMRLEGIARGQHERNHDQTDTPKGPAVRAGTDAGC